MQAEPKSLPYTPLTFILTQTIGLDNTDKNSSNKTLNSTHSHLEVNKQCKYRDIVVPVSVGDANNAYLYYLYHVAPVYNWLRNLKVFGSGMMGYQRDMLANYLSNQIHRPITSAPSLPTQSIPSLKLSLPQIHSSLKQCTRKYEVVKNCLTAKIFINEIIYKSSKLATSPNLQACKHMLKLSVRTADYRYEGGFVVYAYYCKECEKDILISNYAYQYQYIVQEYPLAPIFQQFQTQTIQISTKSSIQQKSKNNQVQKSSFKYKLMIVYTEKFVLVRAANGIWYRSQVNNFDFSSNKIAYSGKNNKQYKPIICSPEIIRNITTYFQVFNKQKIQLKRQKNSSYSVTNSLNNKNTNNIYIYFHEDMLNNCGVLKLAIPLIIQKKISPIKRDQNRIGLENHQIEENMEKSDASKIKQTFQQKRKQTNKHINTQQLHNANIQQQLQAVPEYSVSQILVPQSMPSQTSQKYLQQVQKLYIKPKVKDEYEKDYDKGKTKKIKKKVQYIKPDFNQIFKKVKKDDRDKIQGVYVPSEDQLRGRKNRGRDRNRDRNGHRDADTDRDNNSGQRKFDKNNKRFRGKFGNRKAFKNWKKQKKAQFVKKFQQS